MSALPVRQPTVAEPPNPSGFVASVVSLPEQQVAIPASAFTLAGFRAWAKSEDFPQQGRIAFLERELYIDMSPEELETHSSIKGEITRVLLTLNRKLRLGKLYPDGVLLTNPEVGLSTEADAILATWADLDSEKVRFVPREGVEGQYIEVEGTPTWVLEVVSRYSVRKDTRVLRDLYYRAGVSEYWLVNALGEDIQFDILTRGETEYTAVAGRGGWVRSGVFGRRFRLTRERDERDFWEYTLDARR